LTTVAAVALGLEMLMASQFHAQRHERTEASLSLFLLLLLILVAYFRWSLVE